MKTLKFLFVLLLSTSCGVTVDYDYDSKTDFTKYKTYNYFSDIKSGLSELDAKRFYNALDKAMAAKGMIKSDTPDFYLDFKSSEFQENSRSTVGVGLGGSGRNVGGGISIGIPVGTAKVNRRIVVEFVDDNNTGMFWQAVTESSINPNAKPEQREAHFVELVTKMLSKYPPKS